MKKPVLQRPKNTVSSKLPRRTEIVKSAKYGSVSVTIIGTAETGTMGNIVTMHGIGKKSRLF